ncbi:MAG: hypothetical protein HYT80_09055, partial [Euryarchaeota archaeon]|nr:hypothetical protein [Euryarchaeota archaeon]
MLGLFVLLALPSGLEAQTTPTPPADVKIDMSGSKFDPDAVVVQVNATVTWTNREA